MGTKKITLRGNDNAVRHGGYRQLRQLDGRSREAKIIREIQAALVDALGGDPSPQQILIIQRACVKALRCAAMEHEILSRDGDVPDSLQHDYLRWSRELRSDLLALGLDRRSAEVADLKSYLQDAK